MNIPKSYEALTADLASEKIISKTLRGQKEAYMMLVDNRNAELDGSLAREAALREELYTVRDLHAKQCCVFCNDTGNLRAVHDAIQQRLTVAEQERDCANAIVELSRDMNESLRQRHGELAIFHAEIKSACEDPNNRSRHNSLQMCKFLDGLLSKAALKPAAEGEGS